jgi:LPS O-antigen subunit length determinant protein (WzzB/FepE family)
MLFILQVLIRRRKAILISGFCTAVFAAAVSFLLPKWYTASSSVFPPEPNQFGDVGRAQLMQMLQLPVLGPNARAHPR